MFERRRRRQYGHRTRGVIARCVGAAGAHRVPSGLQGGEHQRTHLGRQAGVDRQRAVVVVLAAHPAPAMLLVGVAELVAQLGERPADA
jgi:hypothetical protein